MPTSALLHGLLTAVSTHVTHGHCSPPGGTARGRMGRKEEDNIGVTLGEDGGPQAPLLPYGSAMRTVCPISQAGKYPHGGGRDEV